LPNASITFNYLGQFDQSFDSDALFRPLDEPAGPAHDPQAPLPNELSIDSQVYGGELLLRWTFSASATNRPPSALAAGLPARA
jgi:non-ribosomal peptide synthase protein (TIGR01720 family)